MPTDRDSTPFPFGTLALAIVALVLYVLMLGSISFSSGGGDASVGRALASFFLTIGAFIALALLLIACAAMGAMPRGAGIAAAVLVPFAGVASFVAIDMCSRHMKWAVVFPVALPLAIAAYALWARFPQWHAAVPARAFGFAVWGFVLVMSAVACLAAAM